MKTQSQILQFAFIASTLLSLFGMTAIRTQINALQAASPFAVVELFTSEG